MQQTTFHTTRNSNCWQRKQSFYIKSTFGDKIETGHLLDKKFMNSEI